jgi:hypothetical protein
MKDNNDGLNSVLDTKEDSGGQNSEKDLGKNIPEAPKDSFSFGVKDGKDGKESFLGDGKKDGEGKDGDDKDGKEDKEESFRDKLISGMKDEMEKSKESGKKIVYTRISIKISDIKSAAEGGSGKMKAEKLTLYEDGSSKSEEIEVEMTQEQAQVIMDEINAEREKQGQGLGGMIKGLFGGGKNKGGVEEEKKDEKEGKNGEEKRRRNCRNFGKNAG